jgi:23S rRNA (cytosine1962-C5)-methyltransferase
MVLMSTTIRKNRPAPRPRATQVRKAQLKINADAAKAVRMGHPWVYRHAILNTSFSCTDGDIIDVTDSAGGFLARGFFETEGIVAVRNFTRDEQTLIDGKFFRAACARALAVREQFLEKELDVYRLIHAEADGLPGLTVTRFGDYLQSILYAPAMGRFVEEIYPALMELTKVRGIYEQVRFKPLNAGETVRRGSQLVAGEQAPADVQIVEDGLKFLVDITAPSSVGFFPDYRLGRRRVRELSGGRRVLNLFSHTGAFSVHALAGGATHVVNVDIAQKAHARARQNAELNGFDPAKLICHADDVFRIMGMLKRKQAQFDLVVVDPPTFSTDKGRTWSGPRDMAELLRDTAEMCTPGALLLVTSNTVKMPMELFEKQVAQGLAHRHPVILERPGLPVDYPEIPAFPESGYLKSILVRLD